MIQNKNQTIQEVKDALEEIYKKGFEIRDILKEKYNNPTIIFSNFRTVNGIFLPRSYTDAKLSVNPDIFYFLLFENFWKLFKIISDNIENPLVQPWIRIIIEQSSDIFLYSEKKEIEKKEIACKYWLCVLGSLGGKQGNLDYDNFLDFLEDGDEKSKFTGLKKKGYPKKEFHRISHELFHSVSENNLPQSIEKYFLNLKGNFISKSQLCDLYRDMSLYHHPNIIMNKLGEEFDDKFHIFRCFTLISVCGISLIKSSTEEIIKEPERDLNEEFNKKINELIKRAFVDLRD